MSTFHLSVVLYESNEDNGTFTDHQLHRVLARGGVMLMECREEVLRLLTSGSTRITSLSQTEVKLAVQGLPRLEGMEMIATATRTTGWFTLRLTNLELHREPKFREFIIFVCAMANVWPSLVRDEGIRGAVDRHLHS